MVDAHLNQASVKEQAQEVSLLCSRSSSLSSSRLCSAVPSSATAFWPVQGRIRILLPLAGRSHVAASCVHTAWRCKNVLHLLAFSWSSVDLQWNTGNVFTYLFCG